MQSVICPGCQAQLQFFEDVSGQYTCPRCLARLPPLRADRSGMPERSHSDLGFRFKLDAGKDVDFDLKGSTWAFIGLAALGFLGVLATFEKMLQLGGQGSLVTYVFAASLGLLLFCGVALGVFEEHPLARKVGRGILMLLGLSVAAIVAVVALLVLLLMVCAAIMQG